MIVFIGRLQGCFLDVIIRDQIKDDGHMPVPLLKLLMVLCFGKTVVPLSRFLALAAIPVFALALGVFNCSFQSINMTLLLYFCFVV